MRLLLDHLLSGLVWYVVLPEQVVELQLPAPV
jgi:hypothetical protein